MNFNTISQLNQAVGTSLGVVGAPILMSEEGVVSLAIKNTGGHALTHFQIQRQYSQNGDWVPWLADTDFATATSKCSGSGGSSGNPPQTLPAGQYAWIDFDPGKCYAFQIAAQAGTATTISITGNKP